MRIGTRLERIEKWRAQHLTLDEATLFFRALTTAIKSHVRDRETLEAIRSDVEGALRGAGLKETSNEP